MNITLVYLWSAARVLATCIMVCACLCVRAIASAESAGTGTKLDEVEQILNPGDVIKIAFPAAPNLDTTQQIRRDGSINLYLAGEIKASGKTPANLQRELQQLYAKELLSSHVIVTIVSSTFAVFVTGAVIRPGKIQPERSITVLEAIMEAGGFDMTKANLKSVVVIRTDNGVTQNFTVDTKALLKGNQNQTKAFYLRSQDIVFVPERFTLF